MAVNGVGSTTTTPSTTGSAIGQAMNPEEVQERFMTLLLEQLKNQDPLNPMDNAQMTSQMSQISMVSGIQQLNQSMGSLTDSLMTNQASQAINLISKYVAVPGDEMKLVATEDGKFQAAGSVWLDGAADSATVKVLDAQGNTVKTVQLKDLESGIHNFAWDGMSDTGVPQKAGDYKISVSAIQGDQTITSQPLQWGVVDSIERDANGNGWSLSLSGGSSPVPLSSVKSVIGS